MPLFSQPPLVDRGIKMLEKDQPTRDGTWTTAEIEFINEKMSLITTKPTIYLDNLTMKDYLR